MNFQNNITVKTFFFIFITIYFDKFLGAIFFQKIHVLQHSSGGSGLLFTNLTAFWIGVLGVLFCLYIQLYYISKIKIIGLDWFFGVFSYILVSSTWFYFVDYLNVEIAFLKFFLIFSFFTSAISIYKCEKILNSSN